MPHVSRRSISKNLYREITEQLWWVLADIRDEKEMAFFLNDLLTSTERMMLAKRLILAGLILRNWEWKDICDFLHVSSATVNRMKIWLDAGGSGFKKAIKGIEKKEKWEGFWKKLDDALSSFPVSKSDMRGRMRLIYGREYDQKGR